MPDMSCRISQMSDRRFLSNSIKCPVENPKCPTELKGFLAITEKSPVGCALALANCNLWLSRPMVRHYCHGVSISTQMCLTFTLYLFSVCPPGFVSYLTSCYLFSNQTSNWIDAEKRCQATHNKAHLVAIETREENNFILQYRLHNDGKDISFISYGPWVMSTCNRVRNYI